MPHIFYCNKCQWPIVGGICRCPKSSETTASKQLEDEHIKFQNLSKVTYKALLSLNVRPWWHNNYQDKDGWDYSLCLGCKNTLYWGGERKHKEHCMFIDIDKAVDMLNEENKTT